MHTKKSLDPKMDLLAISLCNPIAKP